MNVSDGPRPGDVDSVWPSLPVAEWQDTRDTLHMWSQVVGKIRMAAAPPTNHWWHTTLYVSTRGLTTSLIPYSSRGFEIEFDLSEHRLTVETTEGERRFIPLESKPVAVFYAETMATLRDLGINVDVLTRPQEVEKAIPFEEDYEHASYDPDAAHRFWRLLFQAHRVMSQFRGRFVGKASPVHFFWGAFDLAVSRFSGRPAPRHPGGVPNCPDWVQEEAYSHEVSSAGYWPGGGGEGVFYAYAYPEPEGFAQFPIRPPAASYNNDLREFILPYEAVRTAENPDEALLDFLQSTYEAGAELARWDRAALEA
ncbi:MAG: DUF5996 family protein [Actinomycetota bacterium]|jgi:hypothetical protein